jgi:hypothetical protein
MKDPRLTVSSLPIDFRARKLLGAAAATGAVAALMGLGLVLVRIDHMLQSSDEPSARYLAESLLVLVQAVVCGLLGASSLATLFLAQSSRTAAGVALGCIGPLLLVASLIGTWSRGWYYLLDPVGGGATLRFVGGAALQVLLLALAAAVLARASSPPLNNIGA